MALVALFAGVRATAVANVSEAEFKAACAYVQSLPKDGGSITTDVKLQFYGNFKLATVGPCAEKGGDRPGGMLAFEAKAKWDAWNALGSKSPVEARNDYVALLTLHAPEWRR